MNARLYGPKLGRMLSPDVLVGAPNSPLGYNRYVYALNNPISYTDPTGNEPILTALLIGAAVGAAMAAGSYTVQASSMAGGLQRNWNIGAFLKAGFSGAAVGAASGAVSGAISVAFGPTGTFVNELGRATAHGGVGAFFSGLQGGDPLIGFVTSFASTGISHGLEGAGAEALTSGVGGAAFNAGMGAAFSAAQGGDPWLGAAGSLIGFLANQAQHKMKPASAYNYKEEAISGKWEDDWNYIRNGEDGNPVSRWWNTFARDWGQASGPERVGFIMSGPMGSRGMRGLHLNAKPRMIGRGLEIGERFLRPGYKEIAPGVFRSSDGLRQFRMTTSDILGTHGKIGPHFNFEVLDKTGHVLRNYHMPIR